MTECYFFHFLFYSFHAPFKTKLCPHSLFKLFHKPLFLYFLCFMYFTLLFRRISPILCSVNCLIKLCLINFFENNHISTRPFLWTFLALLPSFCSYLLTVIFLCSVYHLLFIFWTCFLFFFIELVGHFICLFPF